VILIGLFVFSVALIVMSARLLDTPEADRAPQSESRGLDALLFLLCLIGVVSAVRRKRKAEEEDF
jgi:hypothetical protein